MIDYSSVFKFTRKPLKVADLALVAPIYDDPLWFVRKYQSRIRKAESNHPTLRAKP